MVVGLVEAKLPGFAVAAGTAGTAITAVLSSLGDHWFRRKEVQSEERAAGSGAVRSMGDAGVLATARTTVSQAMQALVRIDGDVRSCYEALERSEVRLAAALGGSGSVPARLRETYARNAAARKRLEDAHARMLEAQTELNAFQPSIA
jgi:hypothetical protein